MKVLLGPSGIGGVKEAQINLEEYNKLGISAAEIPFTYGVWMSNDQAKKIGKLTEKFNVKLSIHAPYYINLNSKEEKKIEQSKKRIIDSCERGHYLGASNVVFHPGYYGKLSKEKTFDIIVGNIKDIVKEIKEKKWKVKLAPETTGKINVFGDLVEIMGLVKKAKCGFTIDFAHILARSKGKIDYDDVFDKLRGFDHIHCHFSGIEWGDKGEKHHILTPDKEIKELVSEVLKRKKSVTIINESPSPLKDSLRTREEFVRQGYKW